MAPIVSVVITTWNTAAFVSECLESVAAQTWRDLEIVVVDDASTDDTVQRAREFVGELPIRVIELEANHGGPSRPRNIGVAAARGRYITFLDGDDLIEPTCIAEAVELLQRRVELGLVFFNPVMFPPAVPADDRPVLRDFDLFNALPRTPAGDAMAVIEANVAYPCLIAGNYIRTTGLTFPRAVFDLVGPFDETLTNADDWDMWLRIACRYPLGFIDRPRGRIRVHAGSVSTRAGGLIVNRIRVLEKQRNTVLEPESELRIRQALAENLRSLGWLAQNDGDARAASRHYWRSWQEKSSWGALRGILITGGGDRWLHLLRHLRRQPARFQG